MRQIVLMILMMHLFTQCYAQKYISQIPFKYDYSLEVLKKQSKMKETGLKNKTVVNDNSENLSDEVLALKEKYSIILEVMPKEVRDYKLYSYIDEWIGTPYKKQMLEKQIGVDASYFVQALFSDVYGETFSKTPDGIFRSKSIQLFTGRTFLKEGDIVFFRYDKFHPISDVGIYLHNDRILACTAQGLNIYDFNDKYFQLRYVAAGRLKEKQ